MDDQATPMTAASMTRLLFRRVFWCLVAPCFFLSHRAWKQSASFYHGSPSLGDHPPVQNWPTNRKEAQPPTKPRWVLHLHSEDASSRQLPTHNFVVIEPTSACPATFHRVYHKNGKEAALQLDCVREFLGKHPSMPLTFLSPNINNTKVFWKELIRVMSAEYQVAVTALYEPFFIKAARKVSTTGKNEADPWLATLQNPRLIQQHTAAHSLPCDVKVEIKTSWDDVLCLARCPSNKTNVYSVKLPESVPCPSASAVPLLWQQSWEQEQALLLKRANVTRLKQQFEGALNTLCSNEAWRDQWKAATKAVQ